MSAGRRWFSAPSIRAADIGVLLLSAATLMFEITLTRLFSVSQFYHFASMIVSLAMLGFGASGTWLALRPGWGRRRPHLTLSALACGFAIACVGAYLLTNALPFDSFSIAWDLRQVTRLCIHYLALSVPFVLSGTVLGLSLVHRPAEVGSVYAWNLSGSALGCLLALVVPGLLGGTGPVWLSGALGGVAALTFASGAQAWGGDDTLASGGPRSALRLRGLLALSACGLVGACAWLAGLQPAWTALRLSPYKGLSYALQVPGTQIQSTMWNAFSRVDLISGPAIRSLPGLSYRFGARIPDQRGLFVDGDALSPVMDGTVSDLAFADYMPSAAAYRLRPGARTLVLDPRGGLELWTAHGMGVRDLSAVAANSLVAQTAGMYRDTGAHVILEEPRGYVRRSSVAYDVVILALSEPYRPIRSGAYSLGEDYAYTVEAFGDYIGALRPDGLLVVSRWLQTPPSESLRAFALAVEAIEAGGGDPATQIVAYRGYAMMTLLVKRAPFTADELGAIREFVESRAFDLVYAPDIKPEETNRFNVLPSPVYFEASAALLASENRDTWIEAYRFDITPPTDDRPFFGHFFRWSQAGEIVAGLGKTWQPFGGAGYFVLVALLVLSCAAALLMIGLPALAIRRRGAPSDAVGSEVGAERVTVPVWQMLLYFVCLGVGYLFIEIPLMQRAILFLGHPARAVTTVLFSLLLFSGVGSALSQRFVAHLTWVLGAVTVLIGLAAVALPWLFAAYLPLPWGARMVVTVVALAPLGVTMGLPFPVGLHHLGSSAPRRLPWAWAANGAASVVASTLAGLLALSFGFTAVLAAGAAAYLVAMWVSRSW